MNPAPEASSDVSLRLEETKTPVSTESVVIGTIFPQTTTHPQEFVLESVASIEGVSKSPDAIIFMEESVSTSIQAVESFSIKTGNGEDSPTSTSSTNSESISQSPSSSYEPK